MPIVSALLRPLSCSNNLVSGPCFTSGSLSLAVIGALLAPLYVIISVISASLLVQRKASPKNLLAAPHGRLIAVDVLLRSLLSVAYSFDTYLSAWVLIVASIIGIGSQLFLSLRYLPYISRHINVRNVHLCFFSQT